MEQNFEDYLEAFQNLRKDQQSFCSITLVNTRGSAPQDQGARILVDNKNILFGTVGGGKVERKAWDFALTMLEENKHREFVTWNLQKDVGMTCGGEVSLFFEVFRPGQKWKVAIFGAGHVSQELVRSLERLDCEIHCIDPREEWLGKLPTSRKIQQVHLESPKDYVSKLSNDFFVVLMTMGHATDLPILKECLNKDFPYLGMIGSLAKRKIVEHELKQEGIDSQNFKKFICPIGEAIGDNSPVEISYSITSQLLKCRDEFLNTEKRK